MISTRLRNLLEQNGIAFQVLPHDPAFTAQQLAARIHVPGRVFVKAVVVQLDDHYAIAAVPAHRLVDEKALARVAGAKQCRLATEAEFRDLFPECEVGAMPPVGRLYNLPTYVDDEVTRDESIVANAGTHAEAIRLRYLDLARVVEPVVGRFGVPSPTEQRRRRAVRKARPSRAKAASAGGKGPSEGAPEEGCRSKEDCRSQEEGRGPQEPSPTAVERRQESGAEDTRVGGPGQEEDREEAFAKEDGRKEAPLRNRCAEGSGRARWPPASSVEAAERRLRARRRAGVPPGGEARQRPR
jgi:Ala-tRNA(Pro) deacylase